MKSLKNLFLVFMCVCIIVPALPALAEETTDAITITEAAGWFESVYVEFEKLGGADGYNIYVRDSSGALTKTDAELLREYPDNMRADAVGLAAGEYSLKIVPTIDGAEREDLAAETETLTAIAYPREGFAFSESSPCGYTTGGYNADGTPKDGAGIIYVTDTNKDTVTFDGKTGLTAILGSRKNATDPLIVRLIGKVTMPSNVENYMLDIQECENVTIEGIGEDATVHGFGFNMKRARNIEVRNIAIMWYGGVGGDGDSLSLDTENKNIWIHNIDFFYGAPGKDSDQVKGDGSIDIKARSDYITSSYNHFWDSGKACVAGGVWESKNPDDPEAKINITYHHNWFDHSDSRHPRCVAGNTHVYNNYYDGVAKYGVGAAVKSSVFVEKNYFRSCPRPMIIATQGSDCYDSETDTYKDKGTLSGQDGGMIKEFDNYIVGAKRFYTYQTTPDEGEFDAYTVTERDETVPDTVTAKKGGSTYNNFDIDALYEYTPDTPEEAKEKVIKYAGRMNGGDFKWTFDETQDTNSDVIPELQEAVKNYTSTLVSVPAIPQEAEPTATPEASPDASADPSATETPAPTALPISGDTLVHNFTESGLTSSFISFGDGCALKTNKGSIEYDGLTLTTCLEMGSGTKFTFTAPRDGTATFVYSTAKKATAKVNGEKLSGGDDGILSFDISSGTEYTIEKADSGYLYYIVLALESAAEPTTAPTAAPTTAPTTAPTAAPTTAPTTAPTPEYDWEITGFDGQAVTFIAPNDAEGSVLLLVAQYDESGMVLTNFDFVEATPAAGENTAVFSKNIDVTGARIYLWSESYAPLAKVFAAELE